MDDDRFSNHVCHPKAIRKKAHPSVTVVGKENGEVTSVIAVRLVGRIPVFACGLKRIIRIAYFTTSVFMDVKTVRPNRSLIGASRLIGRKPGYLCTHLCSAGNIGKYHGAAKLGRQRSPFDVCNRTSRSALLWIIGRDRQVVDQPRICVNKTTSS